MNVVGWACTDMIPKAPTNNAAAKAIFFKMDGFMNFCDWFCERMVSMGQSTGRGTTNPRTTPKAGCLDQRIEFFSIHPIRRISEAHCEFRSLSVLCDANATRLSLAHKEKNPQRCRIFGQTQRSTAFSCQWHAPLQRFAVDNFQTRSSAGRRSWRPVAASRCK